MATTMMATPTMATAPILVAYEAAAAATTPEDALTTPLPPSPIASAVDELDGDDDNEAVEEEAASAVEEEEAAAAAAVQDQVEETAAEEEEAVEESTSLMSSFIAYVVSDHPYGYGVPVVGEEEEEKEPTVAVEEQVHDDERVVVVKRSETDTSHHNDSTKLVEVEDAEKDVVVSSHSQSDNHEFHNEYAEYDEETLVALKRQIQHMNVILAKIHEIQERTLVQPLQKRLYRSQQQQQPQPEEDNDDDDDFDPDLDTTDDYELPAPSAEDQDDFDFKEDIQGNIPMTASHSEELLRQELRAIDEMLYQALGGGKGGGSSLSRSRELARSEMKRMGLSVDAVAEMDAVAATKSTGVDDQKKKKASTTPSSTAEKMPESEQAMIPQPHSVEEEETRNDQSLQDTNKRDKDDSHNNECGGRDEAEAHNELATSYTAGPTLPSCDCAAMTFLACTDYWGGNVCGIGNSDVDDLVLCNAAPSLRKVAGGNSDKVLLDADETAMESFACMAVDQIERKTAAICKSPRQGDDEDYDDDDDILVKTYPLRKDGGSKQNAANEDKEQPIDDLLLEETSSLSFESERSTSFHQSFEQPPSLSTISEHYSRESLSMTMTTPSNRRHVTVPQEEEAPKDETPFCGDVDDVKLTAKHEDEANIDSGTCAVKTPDNHDVTFQDPLHAEAIVTETEIDEKNDDKEDSPKSTIGLNNVVERVSNAIRPSSPDPSAIETAYDDQAPEGTIVLVDDVPSQPLDQALSSVKQQNNSTSGDDTPAVTHQDDDEPELVAILQRPTASLGSSGQEVVRVPTMEEVEFLQLPLLDTPAGLRRRPDDVDASSTNVENDIPNVSLKRKLRRPSQNEEDHHEASLQYELSLSNYYEDVDDLLSDENTDGCIDPKPVRGDVSDEDMDDIDASELSDVLERLVDRFKTVVSDGDDQPFDCK